MTPVVLAALRKPPHLITRRDALAAGITDREVDRLVRTGTWVAVRRGVYAERTHVESLVERAQRQRLQDEAVALTTRIGHVRSHDSAAVVWRLAVPLPARPVTHLTVPVPERARSRPQRCRFRHGVKHHLAPYDAADRPTVVDGVAVLGLARTAVDLAREHELLTRVAAVDGALRAGVARSELTEVVARMDCWPHVNRVRQAIDLGDPGAESVGETLARMLLLRLGRGRQQTQFGLSRDGRTAFADLRLGRHLFEFDGRLKYRRGVVDDRPAEEVVWEEKRRQDWFCSYRLGMSRLVWEDVLGAGTVAALARLEREVASTEARFGSDISDLAPYVVERRRPAA
ncbi:type IV toxin-antitoxin system AbiEi family antitoxin domain-containing protein [Nocardioides sp. SOB77]|uniref:Type IV toxin-antitoxin system AbiEi family antitoxin domain-containing protein n=1 Tax=Nocardioides oceani TaxID=3058369 RepID=A0ABT8FG89_9ACTN|nr:type IV toxin-antitoxin system AbiEi family antitoxin domain-containing protein [Nocardioides oceani]MDN4173704.1 type IV toxin-antitoxin system AbiEi family antitoxin domain-containing protein [Nocardioides oceani]